MTRSPKLGAKTSALAAAAPAPRAAPAQIDIQGTGLALQVSGLSDAELEQRYDQLNVVINGAAANNTPLPAEFVPEVEAVFAERSKRRERTEKKT